MSIIILKTALALMFSFPYFAKADPPDCAEALQFSRLAISSTEVRKIQSHFYAEHDLAPSSPEIDGLLQRWQIDPAEAPQIVLFSLNNFFGDSLIFHFSLIDYFRKTYPGVPLKIVSPKAAILNHAPSVAGLTAKPFPVRFTEYAKREDRDYQINLFKERMPGFLKSEVEKGAFVFYDLTTFDKSGMEIDPTGRHPEKRPASEFYRVMNDLGVTAIGLSNLENGRIMLGLSGVELVAPVEKIPAELWAARNSHRLRTASGRIVGVRLEKSITFDAENVYASWLENVALLFGASSYLQWDSRSFIHPEDDPATIRSFLTEYGLDASKPYVLLNLNTLGRDKVKELAPRYVSTLEKVVDHVTADYPQYNVLIFFPENQFGPEVQEDVLNLREKFSGRLALVPGSYRELQPALIAGSRWFVTYDSGLNHLASFLPPNRVLTVSLGAGIAELWHRPGQDYIKVPSEQSETELVSKINAWIDRFERP